jgi:hypothetical protein
MLANEPAAHGTQLVAPTAACHLPASHALHVLMPVLEYLPAAHAVQSAAPPPATAAAPPPATAAAPPPATAAAPQVSEFVLLYHNKQVLYQ